MTFYKLSERATSSKLYAQVKFLTFSGLSIPFMGVNTRESRTYY